MEIEIDNIKNGKFIDYISIYEYYFNFNSILLHP